MEKKKVNKVKLGLWIAILCTIVVVLIVFFVRLHKAYTLIKQQNYVASKLLELGDYEQGKLLALQTEQKKSNIISKQLVVVSSGFKEDYQFAIEYAEKYLEKEENALLSTTKSMITEFMEESLLEDEIDYEIQEQKKSGMIENLFRILLQIQNGIEVKKSSASIQAMLELLSSETVYIDTAMLAQLEKEDSILANKVQAVYAIHTGDYTKALEKAEKVFKEDDSFENRAMLANIVASRGVSYEQSGERIMEVRKELTDLNMERNELTSQYETAKSEVKRLKLIEQIETLEAEIQELEDIIAKESVHRAINFIETTTPIKERDTIAYKLELAQLYYKAKEEEKAEELLVEVIEEQENTEAIATLMKEFINAYEIKNGKEEVKYSEVENSNVDLEVYWNQIEQFLYFMENYSYYYDTRSTFYEFVMEVLDKLYHGLIIREIDATEFPTIRVTVNVVMELEERLDKKDFKLVELEENIRDFKILSEEELITEDNISLMLVVDRSGSMGGQPIQDTKKAIANFVKNIGKDITLGLVAFDNEAEVITPLSNNRTLLLKGVDSIYDGGGTSIYLGLQKAGEELEKETGKKVIILLSDGADGDSSMIDEVLAQLKRKNIYVYSIAFGGADTEYLNYIATSCGGKFIHTDSTEVLGEIYSTIGSYMVNDYVFEFEVQKELEEFKRVIRISVDKENTVGEQEYHVGVPFENIEEETKEPFADYFWQIGGSWIPLEDNEE